MSENKKAALLQQQLEFRRALMDRLNSAPTSPSARLLAELLVMFHAEVSQIANRFAELADFMEKDEQTLSKAVLLEGAQKLVNVGGILRCSYCKAEQPLGTAEQIADYLTLGFPRHCGFEMLWITRRELEEGQR
jgi:hypothetical protein